MRDQPLTISETARWLRCSEDEVQGHLEAGQLDPYEDTAAGDAVLVSLNSVVVLAESLPAERGVFQIREPVPGMDDYAGPRSSSGPRTSGAPSATRPPLIVERRPSRPLTRRP